jgi:hypothetical protein
MRSALELEARAQRLALDGAKDQARETFLAAAESYRASWELASPTSYGRLVGMLQASILAGGGDREAAYAREQLGELASGSTKRDSATGAYALAICALVQEDDAAAARWAGAMRGASDAFDRAAEAISALAERDEGRYEAAVRAIVRDFERRAEHLTGVPIADTALMLEQLGGRRGMSAHVSSALLPAL